MATSSITTLLFDLGGVVCDFDPAPRLARLAALSGLPESEVHARLWTSGLATDFDRGRYSSMDWHRLVSERLGLDGLAWGFEQMEEVFLSPFRVNESVLALVDGLDARLRVALFTDNPPLLRDAFPRRFPVLHTRFDPLIFSCDLGLVKSNRGAFALALERLQAPSEEVLFIDDASANVEAAHEAGMRAYRFTSASDLRDHLAGTGPLSVPPQARQPRTERAGAPATRRSR